MSEEPQGGWIPEPEYRRIQERVPILCVDLLPVSPGDGKLGLIHRATPDRGVGWCLIGGAVRRGETLEEALRRHLISTLGPAGECELLRPDPLTIAEYFPEPRPGRLHDPRKHAVALTFVGQVTGSLTPQGEALDFAWFDRGELAGVQFGFGQGRVVEEILARLD